VSETIREGPAPVRVLVAEDEAIIRLDLVELLEAEGYEVVATTGRGDEAARLAMSHQPDVTILDIKMPGMSGIEAAGVISSTCDTAIVILTAFAQREYVSDANAAGVMAYLVKPYQRADLAPAIELALSRFRELRGALGKVEDLERRLVDRKIIDRAKGLLIDIHGMSESDAFGFLQQSAMSARRRMADVADDVIAGSLAP